MPITALQSLIPGSVISNLGWMLVHSLWQMGMVAAWRQVRGSTMAKVRLHWLWRGAIAVAVGLVLALLMGHGVLPGWEQLLEPVFRLADTMSLWTHLDLIVLRIILVEVLPCLIISVLAYGLLSRWRHGPADGELHCRRCNHILRGLGEPRCPECGEAIQGPRSSALETTGVRFRLGAAAWQWMEDWHG